MLRRAPSTALRTASKLRSPPSRAHATLTVSDGDETLNERDYPSTFATRLIAMAFRQIAPALTTTAFAIARLAVAARRPPP
jgi:hypothetical protein